MEAYAHFRLDRQAIPCSKATMLTYEYTLGAFFRWVAREHPEVRRFEDLDVVVVRQYRAEMAERPGLSWEDADARDAERRGSLDAHVLPLGSRRGLSGRAANPADAEGSGAMEGTDAVPHQPAALDPRGVQPAAAAGGAGGWAGTSSACAQQWVTRTT
jgi:hypothetical protein